VTAPLLYAYQREWVNDRARFKIGHWARQIGKTFTTTLEEVDDCFAALRDGRRARWVILSRGERQSKEAMDEGVKRHARAYNLAIESIEGEWRSESGASYKMQEVAFGPDVKITGLPANPDTARGYSANVHLDEFAFHQDSRAIWTALFPVISRGFRLRVTSTGNGKANKFYELMSGHDDGWSRHTVDIYRAVADGHPVNIEELRAALNDEDAWRQEFECQWLDEAAAWLPYDLISSCEDDAAGDPALYAGGPVFIGNDIAVRNNLWIAWVIEAVGDVAWTREVVVRRNISFAEQDAVMDALFDRYDVVRLAIDQTGMGEKPVEDARRRYGSARVDGVILSAARKLALATVLKQRFEDRTIRIPLGDTALRADLHKPRKIEGATGIPRFVAESDAAGHADRFWGAALAAAAAESGEPAAGESVEAARDTFAVERPGLLRPPGLTGVGGMLRAGASALRGLRGRP
jgi:phage FluMu gp28-like protein